MTETFFVKHIPQIKDGKSFKKLQDELVFSVFLGFFLSRIIKTGMITNNVARL